MQVCRVCCLRLAGVAASSVRYDDVNDVVVCDVETVFGNDISQDLALGLDKDCSLCLGFFPWFFSTGHELLSSLLSRYRGYSHFRVADFDLPLNSWQVAAREHVSQKVSSDRCVRVKEVAREMMARYCLKKGLQRGGEEQKDVLWVKAGMGGKEDRAGMQSLKQMTAGGAASEAAKKKRKQDEEAEERGGGGGKKKTSDASGLDVVQGWSCWVEGGEIFVGGRYVKYARNVPQTKWGQKGGVAASLSVEERVLEALNQSANKNNSNADSKICLRGSLGASGREDRDVRMCGSGRPFYLKLEDCPVGPLMMNDLLNDVGMMNPQQWGGVGTCGAGAMKVMSVDDVERVNEGAREKQKRYRVMVRVHCSLHKTLDEVRQWWKQAWGNAYFDDERHNDVFWVVIKQMTPTRVVHRRGRQWRERRVWGVRVEALHATDDQSCLIEVTLTTDAGTYIKELVHGDMGRTQPSMRDLLGFPCTFISLDVADVVLTSHLAPPHLNDQDDDEEDD